ncbi:MAG: hypothetical protein IPM56_00310 [Ignavibacteriales bacterium]|nr:MAG: hypothetical protein IPM56_00310 [Ignavibacteriales bacterium]
MILDELEQLLKYLLILCCVITTQAQTITIVVRDADYIKIAEVPETIRLEVDSLIKSRCGIDIYQNYFSFDSLRSGLYPGNPTYLQFDKNDYQYYLAFPYYKVQYFFSISNKPWERIELIWNYDSLGNLIKDHHPDWLPDCISDSLNCTFEIDSLKAISIAKLIGIPSSDPECIKAMLITERIDGLVRFVWIVTSDIDETNTDYFLIDINSGEVLRKGKYTISF